MLAHHDLTEPVIGLAVAVHKQLGPGLLESVYVTCLALELKGAGIPFRRQAAIPVAYRGFRLHTGFRADPMIDQDAIVEIKAVERSCRSMRRSYSPTRG